MLSNNLRTLLQNIVSSAKVDLVISELNDISLAMIATHGCSRKVTPLIHLRPDPAAGLGPSFGLVDEGCDAFDGFIEDLGTDSTLRGRSAHKP